MMQALEKEIEAAQKQGKVAVEAGLRGQKAAGYILNSDWKMAAIELDQAAKLAEGADQSANQAQILLALGKVLLQIPDQSLEAIHVLQKASKLYQKAEQPAGMLNSLPELARAHIARDETDAALWTIDQALELARLQDASATQIELYQLQAGIGFLRLNWALVRLSLRHGIMIAHRINDSNKKLLLQSQLTALETLESGQASPESLQQLQKLVVAQDEKDNSAASWLIKAQASSQLGNFAKAQKLAEKSVQSARLSSSPERFAIYLQGTMILSFAAEQTGDFTAVLAALLRCRSYLSHHLGGEVGEAIDQILDRITSGWGEERLAQTIQQYQQQIERNGKIEA